MEQLNFVGTEDTPAISIDRVLGTFKISGRSLPEDVKTFYKPVIDWLDKFSESPAEKLNLEIKLEYFNTASSKIILDILMKLEGIHSGGACFVSVNWMYAERDDDMLEAGDEYKDLVEIPFELIAY